MAEQRTRLNNTRASTLFIALIKAHNNKLQISFTELADYLLISRRSAIQLVERFQKAKVLFVTKQTNQANTYSLLNTEEAAKKLLKLTKGSTNG